MVNSNSDDTIAAISSGLTEAGVGIIRISGKEAARVADSCVRIKGASLETAQPGHMYYSHVSEGDQSIDEALVFIMRGPHSYTGEDVVEIQCHGGAFVMKRILKCVLDGGARLAEPGEFTKRAFLNGRLDLAQAEAVMALIGAQNEYSRIAAMEQLSGSLSDKINKMRDRLMQETAYLEAALDDPEHISLDGFSDRLLLLTEDVSKEIDKLIESSEGGRVLREGINTVILGSPNVGKSSVMNLLLDNERAIVTSVPGTTRDVLEETLRIGGFTLLLSDTAGLRASDDVVEQIGVRLAEERAEAAELILYVADGSEEFSLEREKGALDIINDKRCIVLLNKADLLMKADPDAIRAATGREPIIFSAKTGQGKEELTDRLREMFKDRIEAASRFRAAANERQIRELKAAAGSLLLVKEAIEGGVPEDLYTVDLMDAYSALSRIVGESVEDDLVDRIFSEFCMGK